MTATTAARGRRTEPGPGGQRGTRIALHGIRKDYGGLIPAVDGVDLIVEPGEFMTLLGPSGSGKTTTLNLIAGFETLTSGTITLDDREVSLLPPHKRNLGMLFQSYALFPHMTVAQNVAYPLRERRVPAKQIAERVARVLELVQLTGRDSQYPAQLSGGQQQRVALARAIVFEPQALLLDEPLGALDRNLRAALQEEIRRIHRELGATFVFVTHDQEEAMNLSDRIALFNAGRIEQVGTPEELYRRPETLFAAQFFGDSNVFALGEGPVRESVAWAGRSWTVDPTTVSESAKSLDGGTALMVRPESVELASTEKQVPAGANAATARVRDIEYMGAYRTVLLDFTDGTRGKARVEALPSDVAVGDELVAWWRASAQRIVAA